MKQYIMECIGTFLLTLAVAFIPDPAAAGFMLMALIYLGGHISGAYYNPAVVLAAHVGGYLKVREAVLYTLCQCVGAIVALCMQWYAIGAIWSPQLHPFSLGVALSMEALLTMVFCWVVFALCLSKRYSIHGVHGIVVGLTLVTLAGLGGVVNPALVVGSLFNRILIKGVISDIGLMVAIYIVASCVGAIGAAYLYLSLNPDEKP